MPSNLRATGWPALSTAKVNKQLTRRSTVGSIPEPVNVRVHNKLVGVFCTLCTRSIIHKGTLVQKREVYVGYISSGTKYKFLICLCARLKKRAREVDPI